MYTLSTNQLFDRIAELTYYLQALDTVSNYSGESAASREKYHAANAKEQAAVKTELNALNAEYRTRRGK